MHSHTVASKCRLTSRKRRCTLMMIVECLSNGKNIASKLIMMNMRIGEGNKEGVIRPGNKEIDTKTLIRVVANAVNAQLYGNINNDVLS